MQFKYHASSIDSDVVCNEEAQVELKAVTKNGRQERGHVLSHLHNNIFCKFYGQGAGKFMHTKAWLTTYMMNIFPKKKTHEIKQNT